MHDFPAGGVLIGAEKELFLAREVNGTVTVVPASNADTGNVSQMHAFPSGGMLIGAEKGLFVTVPQLLQRAVVTIGNKKDLDGLSIDRAVTPEFLIAAHGCTAVADKLGLKVRVAAPGEKALDHPVIVVPDPKIAHANLLNIRVNKAGQWAFQVIATSNDVEGPVGDPQTLNFVSGPWRERWWKTLTTALALVLALANVVLFAFARRSSWAWRLATDDSLGTWVVRVATLLMSHIPQAQLWIIDLYFQRIRGSTLKQSPRPFLPLPLSARDGRLCPSTEAVAPPWTEQRLWVQGGSGMGKTALFRNVTETHFREHETAFAAHAKWGCVLVAFAAQFCRQRRRQRRPRVGY
jgi:hypothetical protein